MVGFPDLNLHIYIYMRERVCSFTGGYLQKARMTMNTLKIHDQHGVFREVFWGTFVAGFPVQVIIDRALIC